MVCLVYLLNEMLSTGGPDNNADNDANVTGEMHSVLVYHYSTPVEKNSQPRTLRLLARDRLT